MGENQAVFIVYCFNTENFVSVINLESGLSEQIVDEFEALSERDSTQCIKTVYLHKADTKTCKSVVTITQLRCLFRSKLSNKAVQQNRDSLFTQSSTAK